MHLSLSVEIMMERDDRQLHSFLISGDNELSTGALEIPKIRAHIDELPETATTFRVTDVPDITPSQISTVHMEFVGSWPVPERYLKRGQRARRFVNPYACHASSYTDIIVSCECGATMNRMYSDGDSVLDSEHEHTDGCLPQYLCRAQTHIHESRYELVQRLSELGLRGPEIAPRLGIRKRDMGSLIQEYNLTMTALRKRYRDIAGATYAFLVREHGEHGPTVADVYGHSQSTLSKWATAQSVFEPTRELVQNDQTGIYEWA